MTHPAKNDVIIRRTFDDPSVVFLLGTPAAPEQLILRTLDEAVSHATRFAEAQRVAAWSDKGDGDYLLLVSFRGEVKLPRRHATRFDTAADRERA
jgi:hypothetical protein